MNALFASALRLAVILLGYVAACLAASAFMHLLFLGSQDFSAEQMQWIVTGSLIFTVPFVALFVAYFALLPAAAVIVAGELLRRRDWLFYGLGGGLAGLAVAAMFRQGAGGTAPAQDEFGIAFDAMPVGPRLVGFMIGSGIVAGLAYWLVAGRFSLGWRGQPDGRLTSREP